MLAGFAGEQLRPQALDLVGRDEAGSAIRGFDKVFDCGDESELAGRPWGLGVAGEIPADAGVVLRFGGAAEAA